MAGVRPMVRSFAPSPGGEPAERRDKLEVKSAKRLIYEGQKKPLKTELL